MVRKHARRAVKAAFAVALAIPIVLGGTANAKTIASPTITVAWSDVASEQLPHVLDTHLPVCSSCHLITWFQHEHPDLVVDRHRVQETDAIVH